MKQPVFVVLSQAGAEIAGSLVAGLETGEIHAIERQNLAFDATFTDTVGHLNVLFAQGRPIVGVCAAGILIRALAPVLADKKSEPPVVAVAEDGSAVVPLIGGHHGANDLARRLAAILGVKPAITTAGDTRFGIALDAPPEGWTLANPQDAKAAMAALLAGEAARLEGEAPWLAESRLPFSDGGRIALAATERRVAGGPERLVYHPKLLALGVGCERGCDPQELIALADEALAKHDLAQAAVALVSSLDLKADESAVHALAGHLGVAARFFGREALAAETHRLANPSETVRREVGVAGVAEAAALAAAGPEATLLVEKTKSKRATCAIARAPRPLDPWKIGRARGRLSVVGIGPGGAEWLSPEAERLLREAGDWVGYGAYLDLAAKLVGGRFLDTAVPPHPAAARPTSPHRGEVDKGPSGNRGEVRGGAAGPHAALNENSGPLHLSPVGRGRAGQSPDRVRGGVRLHRFDLGEEETRVRHALKLAGEGRDVALVSSGDPGIYAMAALVHELLDPAVESGIDDAARRAEIRVAPGISAFQAAAARAGAPLGHDFCLISLSDLLTPWEAIESRVRAAAAADFAVCFYNPRSRRRRDQLDRAMTILKKHRLPETPVVVAANLGRREERLTVTTLDAFDAGPVDMLTVILVGASTTRAFAAGDGTMRVYTPRGYGAKREAAP